MATWNDYKKHVRESNPEIGRDIDEVEERAKIVSSVARIESGKSSPNLTTLLKIFDTLGLTLTVQTDPHRRISSIAK